MGEVDLDVDVVAEADHHVDLDVHREVEDVFLEGNEPQCVRRCVCIMGAVL